MEIFRSIDNAIALDDYTKKAVELCKQHNLVNMLALIRKINPTLYEIAPDVMTVKICCNWMTHTQLREVWKKFVRGDIVYTDQYFADYYVIINRPRPEDYYEPSKTIIFQMEPNMDLRPDIWGAEWANPDPNKFLSVNTHKNSLNMNEWHLARTYSQLSDELRLSTLFREGIGLSDKCSSLSIIISEKYNDPGQKLRVDFAQYIDRKDDPGLTVDVYGSPEGHNGYKWKNYKGTLPMYEKDKGLYPYKYSFNAENHAINNYYTEKLVDCIMAETLCFYWGCPNAESYINERAFVRLPLQDFEADYNTIVNAIKNDEHTKRLEYIREAKKKILENYSLFARIDTIIKEQALK